MARVLFATDRSDAADVAERLISSIHWPPETSVRVVTVVPWARELVGSPWTPVTPVNSAEIEAAILRTAEAAVKEASGRLAARGLDASWVVMRGQPADAIVDVARQEDADLIVVGSRGLGALEGALLGSVSEAVADRAPCPVLIARLPEIHHSLIADDSSPGAALAVEYVRSRPHLLGYKARLVAVDTISDTFPETFDLPIDAGSIQTLADDHQQQWRETRSALDRDAESLRQAGVITDVELENGRPGDAIIEAARRWHADIAIIGSRHRTGLTRLVLGSVGRYVLHHSHCSVLLVGRAVPNDAEDVTRKARQPARPVLVG